jgi:WD40 repeat protein
MRRRSTRTVAGVLLSAAGFVLAAGPLAPIPTADLQGDPLPPGARARLGSGRLRHGYTVSALAFAPDGKTLASTAYDHTVRIWDVKTGKAVIVIGEHQNRNRVYSQSRWVNCVAFSPDGKVIASGSQDRAVHLWDAATGKERRRVLIPNGVSAVALTDDAKTIATLNQVGKLELRDLTLGRDRMIGMGRDNSATRITLSPDGKTLATGARNGSVRLIDPLKPTDARVLEGHGAAIHALAWSADGKRLAACANDDEVIVWDTATTKVLARRTGSRGEINWLAFLPDNKTLVSVGEQQPHVRIWDASLKKVREFTAPVAVSMALSPDGKTLALGGHFSAIWLIDLATGKPRDLAPGHHGHIHFVVFSADSRRVTTGGSDGWMGVWDASTNRTLTGSDPGTAIAMSRAGDLAATKNSDQPVRLWDPAAGKLVRVLKGSEDATTMAAMSADGRKLATSHPGGMIRLWDTATGKELIPLKGHRATVTALALSPDGRMAASAGDDDTVRLWDVVTGGELRQAASLPAGIVGQTFRKLRLAFSPDGRALAGSGSGHAALVWETASGELVRLFQHHQGYVMSLAFSPDGRSLATGNWVGVRLWNLTTGEGRGEAFGHKGDVMALGFSPDGRRLASGGSDTVAYLWDVATAFKPPAARVVKLSEKDLESRWEDLAKGTGEKAYQAMWDLTASPASSVPMLEKRLRPVKPASEKVIAKLIADLDDDDFETRQKASEALAKLGEVAETALRKALASAKDVDLKLRLNVLVGNLKATSPPPETLRMLRAVQALELAKTPAAEKLLRELAEGSALARQTREAKAALARMR